MKKQSNHTGLWIGIILAIVTLAAAGILLTKGLLKSLVHEPSESTGSAAAPTASRPVGSTEDPGTPQELSEKDLEQIGAAQLSLEQLREKADYQAAAQAERADQVMSVLKSLEADGSVEKDSIYYDEEAGCVSYLLAGGVLAAEKLFEDPEEDGFLPLSSSVSSLRTASSAGERLPENSFANAVILNAMTDRINVMDYCRRLQSAWTQAGLKTELDTEVTVEDMKNLAGYAFVYVKAHGCFITYPKNALSGAGMKSLSVIVLEQHQSTALNREYRADLAGGRLVLVNGCYCITPDFIRAHYGWGSLNGRIMFFGCCQLMGKNGQVYEGWTSAFEQSSLGAFVAFHNSNYTMYNLNLVDTLVEELLSGNDISAAFESALARHGENDAVWYGKSDPDRAPGTPLLRGNSQVMLKNTPDWQSVYSDFILNGGYLASGQPYDVSDEDMGLAKIAFALHDLDEDGIPELIANAGFYAAGSTGYVYACRDGQIVLLGGGPENRSRLYYSPYEPGLFERMDPGPAIDPVGRIYVYLYWSLEDGQLAWQRIAEEYSNDPAKQIEDEDLYLDIHEAFDRELLVPWLTPDQIRETGWRAFVESWKERKAQAQAVRDHLVDGLSAGIAQAFLDVLPKEQTLDGNEFITAAFPDMDQDGIPEIIWITRYVDDSFPGYTHTIYILNIYAFQDGTAQLKHQDYCFDHGGTYRAACRIYQTASGDLVDSISFLQELGAGQDHFVFSYKNGWIEKIHLSEYENASPHQGVPSTFGYFLDQQSIPEETYRQYVSSLTEPVKTEIFHAQDQWGGGIWDEFLGDLTPMGLSYSQTVRLLTDAGAVPRQTENVVASGSCGENVSWSVNDEGTLRIYGKGELEYYVRLPFVPWRGYASSIRTIVIEDGVSGSGGYAFSEMQSIESIYIGSGITILGDWIFYSPDSLTAVYLARGITVIEAGAFASCQNLQNVYFAGSEAEWAAVQIGADNRPLSSAVMHFGSYPIP